MSAEHGVVAAVSRNDAYTFTKPNRDEIVLVAGLGVEGDVHAGPRVRHRSRVAVDPEQPNLRQVHLIHAELFEEVAAKGYEVPAGGLGENVTTSGIDLLGLPRGTILRFGGPEAGRSEGGGLEAGGLEAGGLEAGGLEAGGLEAGRLETSRPEAGASEVGAPGAPGAPGAAGTAGGGHAVGDVLAAASAARLNEPTARAAEAVSVAAERDAGVADERPAVVLAGLRNPCAQINRFQSGLLKEVLGHDDEGNLVRKAGVMAVVLRGGPIRPGDPVTVELPPGTRGPLECV